MDIYEVHVFQPGPGRESTRHTDIREAVREYLNHPDIKLRINIDGLVLTLDENMIGNFHGFGTEDDDDQTRSTKRNS